MDLILLPGNDAKNKEWIEWVAESVKARYDRRIVQYYDHWTKGGEISPEVELKKLSELALGLEAKNIKKVAGEGKGEGKERVQEAGGYAVFGKSVGVVLALGAIAQGAIAPKKCIFVGSAIGFGKRLGLPVEEWLIGLNDKQIPTVFIQQENDPAISADDLETLLQKIGFTDYQLIKVPGGDHIYKDLPLDSV